MFPSSVPASDLYLCCRYPPHEKVVTVVVYVVPSMFIIVIGFIGEEVNPITVIYLIIHPALAETVVPVPPGSAMSLRTTVPVPILADESTVISTVQPGALNCAKVSFTCITRKSNLISGKKGGGVTRTVYVHNEV